MDLLLDLNTGDGIWIDGTNKVFKGSEFEGLRFRVKVKPLTRTELRKIRRESVSSRGNVEQDLYLPKIFMSHVIDWEIKDGDGQPIPFSEESKKLLVEKFPGFTNLIATACLDGGVRAAEEAEDEVKNSLTSGAGD